jgi:hypothetical protein
MILSAMNKLSMWELPVVLHMDGMFKLNENEFLVISLTQDISSDLFPGVPFLPNYLMTDAEHAVRTALVSVFAEADKLMCFFHVIKASKEKLSGNKDRDIMKNITLLHMSLSQ